MRMTMKKLTQGATRLLVLALGLGLVSTGWAEVPVPTAVWESGQFADAANLHGGYSISLNGNTINEGGNIVIKSDASSGVTIDVTDVLGNDGRDMSLLIKYSNATAPTSQAVFTCVLNDNSGTYDTGLISSANNAGTLVGYYNKTSPYTLKKSGVNNYPDPTSTGSGCFLYSYKNQTDDGVTQGVYGYNGTTIATLDGGSNSGLCWPNRRLHKIAIGGPSGSIADTYAVWPNLIIEKVAIFVGKAYSNADIAGYRWPSEIKAVLPERDMINLNISNGDGYAITGSGVDTISTLAGEMLDNAWQNTPSGNAVVSGDARNGRVTGVTAYDGTSKEATTLSDVTFTWAVEGSGTANYGNVDIENNPTFHKAWLARFSKAAETSSILVQSIPYRKYDIIVYCFGADDSAFNPVFVNGVPYVGDTSLATDTKTRKATSSSETWGECRALPSLGQTAIMLKGLENPELSLTIRSGATSICAVQILRDMSEGVWPTSKKVISLNLMSAYSSNGTTPSLYGLEPVPNEAWTKDGLSEDSPFDKDVAVTIKEWNGSTTVDTSVTLHEKGGNGFAWSGYNYTPQSQFLTGYIDDTSQQQSVTVGDIPYACYDVIVYCATDNGDKQFGPVTVNGTSYRWDDDKQCAVIASSGSSTAETRWGATQSRLPAYGRNAIRIPDQTASTLTITGGNNANNARGGIAAIQIVEAYSGLKVYSNGSWSGGTEPTSGDAIIVVDGDTALAIDGTANLDTVTITGTGTLTLSGSGKFTATTIEVESLATVNANPDRLDATTYVGSGTVVYSGGAPETGKGWTDPVNWTGTVQVKDVDNMAGDGRANCVWLKFNDYGNSGSVVEMNNVTGWLETGYTCTVPLKITGTLYLNNGGSGKAYAFKVGTLLGSGTISGDGSATTVVFNITDDWSGFTGTIGLNNKCVVFGETIPDELTAGTIYVSEGAVVTPQQASGTWWAVGGIKVDGELRAPNLDKFGGGTTITTTDNGIFTLLTASQIDDQSTSYARITGTGTLRYADGGGNNWRTLSQTDFPTGMICENNISAGLILKTAGGNHTIGSLAGSGVMRSDWGGSQNVGDRSLKILQAKDTVYSGLFHSDDRITTVTVAPGASSFGTLTLSNTQTVSNDLVIESGAKVNLTGTWVGATTVAGTFGGIGTLTGNLTFSDGATFKAFATDENGLSVSGTVTLPDSGTVTVDVGDLTVSSSGTTLMTFTSAPSAEDVASKMMPSSGTFLKLEGSTLKAYPLVATYKGVNYSTFEAAINVALADEGGEANLAKITVIDDSAELPAGYYIEDNAIKQYQAAVVDTEGTAHYYPTAQGAVDDINSYLGMATQKEYDYFAVYFGTEVEMSIDLSAMAWRVRNYDVKVKCSGATTVQVVPNSVEYEFSAGTPDENGVVTYEKIGKATTYVWVGTGDSSLAWANFNYWKIGTSEGSTATRAPSTLDTAILNGGAPISFSGADVSAIQIGGAACLVGSGTLTATSGGIVLTDAAATITVTGVTLSPEPTTTVANSYVKKTGSTYAVQAYVTVTIPSGVEHATATVNGNPVAGGASVQVDAGSNVTIAWTAASGYKITDGATQTINAIATDVTATAPTVEAKGATVSDVNFTYGADYATATVTATVTGDATSATLSYGNATYNTNVVNGTVTFENVAVTRGNDIYAEADYTITAKDGETDVTTTGGTGSTVAADVINADWINERAASATGTSESASDAGGAWTNAVTYTDGTAAISDNRFAATEASTSSRVVLEFEVCFSSACEDDVSGDAQAAIKLGDGDNGTTFMVLTTGKEWTSVSNAKLPIDASETYTVVLTIDYGTNTYKVDVDGNSMTNSAGVASFALAMSTASVQNIDFAGSGTLTSLKGDQLEGYMVKDALNNFYATIEAAIQAYNSANGPYTVLHEGATPSGWKIVNEGGVDILKKIARGLFIIAY